MSDTMAFIKNLHLFAVKLAAETAEFETAARALRKRKRAEEEEEQEGKKTRPYTEERAQAQAQRYAEKMEKIKMLPIMADEIAQLKQQLIDMGREQAIGKPTEPVLMEPPGSLHGKDRRNVAKKYKNAYNKELYAFRFAEKKRLAELVSGDGGEDATVAAIVQAAMESV